MGLWTTKDKTDLRKKCPPVEDCGAKNLRHRNPTAKERRAAAKLARDQAKAQREAAELREQARQARLAKQRQRSWPNKGSYNPKVK